jgi:hypothetical protein
MPVITLVDKKTEEIDRLRRQIDSFKAIGN